MQWQLQNLGAWPQNHQAFDINCAIHPILNEQGQKPDNFPATVQILHNMTHSQLGDMLEFYGLNRDPIDNQLYWVKVFLGMRLVGTMQMTFSMS